MEGNGPTVNPEGALNSQGDVVGSSNVVATTTTSHPFLFRNGTLTDLGIPAGFNTGGANGVNDFDQVVGQLVSGFRRSATSHAFVWQNGAFRDLGTLGGASANANGINDSAQIVGWALTASGQSHAFLWQNGVMTDLGTLPGGFSSSRGHQQHRPDRWQQRHSQRDFGCRPVPQWHSG